MAVKTINFKTKYVFKILVSLFSLKIFYSFVFLICNLQYLGRLIILFVGLYEFFAVLIPPPKSNSIATIFHNFLKSIPNDDDIELVYAKERKEVVERHAEKLTTIVNNRKMNLCLSIVWKDVVHVKYHVIGIGGGGSGMPIGAAGGGGGAVEEWTEVVLCLQGTRLVWWLLEEETDIKNSKVRAFIY